jgi:hypothetical protein
MRMTSSVPVHSSALGPTLNCRALRSMLARLRSVMVQRLRPGVYRATLRAQKFSGSMNAPCRAARSRAQA